MTDLASRWRALVGATTGADPDAARDAGRDLLRRWSQPHRHYHDITHLVAVLDNVDLLLADDAPAADPSAVRLAAWFHDAVYDGRPGEDERASAALARSVLSSLGLPASTVDEVVRLVLLTAGHDPAPDDPDGAVLCDADLAVLGADPDSYADYARRVRLDYAHVDDEVFRIGRAAVLRRLLDLDPLFHTAAGRRRWAGPARTNLCAELAGLREAR